LVLISVGSLLAGVVHDTGRPEKSCRWDEELDAMVTHQFGRNTLQFASIQQTPNIFLDFFLYHISFKGEIPSLRVAMGIWTPHVDLSGQLASKFSKCWISLWLVDIV